jgi:prolyl oligopeptidase
LRVDTGAGHGTGKPTTKVIEEAADMLAFAARWTGLKLQ